MHRGTTRQLRPRSSAAAARTLSDRVQDAILSRIVDGSLEPGAFVREEEVGAALAVSRTPVREALARLAADGVLERLPHRGYRVPPDSFARLLELYPIISSLEVLAGRLAFAQAASDDVVALRALNERMRRATRRGDTTAAIDLNNRFHAYIAELAGNERLSMLLDDLRQPLRRLEGWYYADEERAERSAAEHDALLDALVRGRPEEALAIFEHNMELTTVALAEAWQRQAGQSDE